MNCKADDVIFVTDRFYREIDLVYQLHDAIADYQDVKAKLHKLSALASDIVIDTEATILPNNFYSMLNSLVSSLTHTSIYYVEDCNLLQDTLDYLEANKSEDKTYKVFVNNKVREHFAKADKASVDMLELIDDNVDIDVIHDTEELTEDSYSNLVWLVYVRGPYPTLDYDPSSFIYFNDRSLAYEFANKVELRLNDQSREYDNVYVCGMSEGMAKAIKSGDLDPEFDADYSI